MYETRQNKKHEQSDIPKTNKFRYRFINLTQTTFCNNDIKPFEIDTKFKSKNYRERTNIEVEFALNLNPNHNLARENKKCPRKKFCNFIQHTAIMPR